MEQVEFTKSVVSKLLAAIPQFSQLNHADGDYTRDVEIVSNKGDLAIWLGTEDMEITVGLSGVKSSGWHMHLNRFEECILTDEIDKAIRFIQSVLYDKRQIFYSSIYGYTLNDADFVFNHRKPDEIIETRYWSEI
jgi:hypothetical protein